MENHIYWNIMNWIGKIKIMNWSDEYVGGMADHEIA